MIPSRVQWISRALSWQECYKFQSEIDAELFGLRFGLHEGLYEDHGVSNRDILLKSYEAGNFLGAVYACLTADRNSRSALASDLVALHNEGLIDVVVAFETLRNNTTDGPDFFLTRHVFEEALPSLDAPVQTVMRCVLSLYRCAGQDLAAGTVIEGYIGFCAKDPSRPSEALTEIEAGPDELADLLPATLIAGSRIDNPFYLAQAIRLCEEENIVLKRHAMFSLGMLSWPEGMTVSDSAIAALVRAAAAETDDLTLANIVKSAFALVDRVNVQEARILALIADALLKGGDYTLHAASEAFRFNAAKLPASFLETLFVHLVRVKSTNKGTLDNVDYGIAHLLKKGDPERAIQFLEDLLLANPNELTMKAFDDTAREILGNKALISKILTRWFQRGDRVLCEGVHIIVGTRHNDELPLEIDPNELKAIDLVHIVFIARKTIGYLFMRPISAVAVLISLMRLVADDDVLSELGALLFDPLLLNYTGKGRDYVVQQSGLESGKVKVTIDDALKAIDDYLDDLRSVGNLAALHPGEAQREAYHRHFSHLMAESFKDAEAQSIFLHLVSKSVLLYGKKSISYVHGPDGQSHRMETPLQSHGTEIEFPRMENLDPFGLDYMLRVFRVERLST